MLRIVIEWSPTQVCVTLVKLDKSYQSLTLINKLMRQVIVEYEHVLSSVHNKYKLH